MKIVIAVCFGFLTGLFACKLFDKSGEGKVEVFSVVLMHDIGLLRKVQSGHVSSIEEELKLSISETLNEVGMILSYDELSTVFANKEEYVLLYDVIEMAFHDMPALNEPERLKMNNTRGLLNIVSARNNSLLK